MWLKSCGRIIAFYLWKPYEAHKYIVWTQYELYIIIFKVITYFVIHYINYVAIYASYQRFVYTMLV
jgi:hypothetical protein